jgi:acyl-homoserine-lactone acylase
MRGRTRWTGRVMAIIATTAAMLTPGVSGAEPAGGGGADHGLAATIRYTEYGVPHIKAADFGGLGYGYGFAAAKDNICALADVYVTVGARRSRYFGPDTPGNEAYGATATSLASDLYFQRVNDSRVVERALARPAPLGPRREVREIIRGYVAGYNRFLRETGVRHISDPACRGGAWVRPIAELDVYRHLHAVATLGGEGAMVDALAAAQPPTGTERAPAKNTAAVVARVRDALARKDMGSNAIAIGSDGTVNGRGLLLGNPHFPWHGGRRFWQAQLTVPGKLDVSGASLLGMPLVQIGFNRDVAWSHTVSTANPLGFYEVPLVAGDPTTYLVDGRRERMTSHRVSVPVRNADGSLGTVERTFYATRYGPVVSPVLGLPLPWTTTSAFAVRDANMGNLRGLNTWFDFARAHDTGEIEDALSRTQGVPWVNTIATDQDGHALYAQFQVVPHVTDEQAGSCNTPFGKALFAATGLPLYDGSRGECAWGTDPDALVPGTFGPSRMPVLTRADYVENSNDSPWLSNPGTSRSPATRASWATSTPCATGAPAWVSRRSRSSSRAAGSPAGRCRTCCSPTAAGPASGRRRTRPRCVRPSPADRRPRRTAARCRWAAPVPHCPHGTSGWRWAAGARCCSSGTGCGSPVGTTPGG